MKTDINLSDPNHHPIELSRENNPNKGSEERKKNETEHSIYADISQLRDTKRSQMGKSH